MGTGNCALLSHFKRAVCACRDSSSCGTCCRGGGDLRGRLWLVMSPSESLCSSDCACHTARKGHQCCREVWVCQVHTRWTWACTHGHYHHQKTRSQGLVQPRTYHRHQVVLNTSKARGCRCCNILSQGSSSTKSAALETAPAQSTGFALFPVAESCGSACVGCRALGLSPGISSLGRLTP